MPFFASGGNTYGYQGQFNTYQAPFNLTNSIGGGKLVVWFDPTLYCGSGNWFDRSRNNVLIAEIENGVGIKTDENLGVLTASSNNYRFPPGPTSTGIAYMSSFTISAWVKRLGALSTNSAIITQSWSNSGGRNLQMYASDETRITAGFFSTNTYTPGVSALLMCNVWQNVTLRFSNNQMNLYLNGINVGGSTIAISPENTDRFYRIGRCWDVAEYFNGEIGDVMLYNSGFSSAAALELFQKMKGKYETLDPGIPQWTTLITYNATIFGDEYIGITTDTFGNLYATSVYRGTPRIFQYSNVSAGIIYISSFGSLAPIGGPINNVNIFLAKYNSSGNVKWVTSIGGTTTDIPLSIVTDTSENVIVSGVYNSASININNYSNISAGLILVSTFGSLSRSEESGAYDTILVKYNSSGIAHWATKIGGTSNDINTSITTDLNDNIYIAGEYVYQTTINSYSNVSAGIIIVSSFGTLSNYGSNDIYLAKYNSNGYVEWTTNIGGTNEEQKVSIANNINDGIYLAGFFNSSTIAVNNYSNVSDGVIYLSTFGTLSNSGLNDNFLAKYNSNGSAQWVTSIGGAGSNTSIASDSNGNIYVSGYYSSSPLTIYNYSNVSDGVIYLSTFGTLSNSGLTDIFLAKYNSNGSAQWATNIGGTNNENYPSISTDIDGNIFITGQYLSDSLTFNSYSNISGGNIYTSTFGTLAKLTTRDIFLAKYNSSGIVQSATRVNTCNNIEFPNVTTSKLDNSVYLCGSHTGTASFTINNFSNVSDGVIYVSTFGSIGNLSSLNITIFLTKYTYDLKSYPD